MSSRDGWRRVRFGEMAENVTERIDDPSQAGVERYVGLEHLDPESLAISRWGLPTDVEATKLRFLPGDIIFGRRRAYQRKLAVADFEGICSAHALVLRAKPDVALPRFLPFFMQSDAFFERALSISVGSLSPTINWKALKEQEFDVPPIDEQPEIAEVLWAAEQARLRLIRLVDGLKRTARLVLERETQHGSYEQVPLGELLTGITAGRSLSGAGRPVVDGELGVLKVSAVGASGFAPEENKVLLDQTAFESRYAVRRGDLLMTRSNTRELVGRACIADIDAPHLMLSDKTLRLDVDASLVNPIFLLACLSSQAVRRQIESIATGTGGAMKNISQTKIRGIRVVAPPLDEQDRILEMAMSFELAAEQADQQRRLTMQLRNALLAELGRW